MLGVSQPPRLGYRPRSSPLGSDERTRDSIRPPECRSESRDKDVGLFLAAEPGEAVSARNAAGHIANRHRQRACDERLALTFGEPGPQPIPASTQKRDSEEPRLALLLSVATPQPGRSRPVPSTACRSRSRASRLRRAEGPPRRHGGRPARRRSATRSVHPILHRLR